MKNFEVQHTIRIYDPELIAEIGRTFDAHHREFKNKNEFLTHLLRLGVKAMKATPPTAPSGAAVPPVAAVQAVMDELKDIRAITSETSKYLTTQFKKLYILAAIYNMQLGELSGTPPLPQKVEDGFFDDLPLRFEKIIVSLENSYGLK